MRGQGERKARGTRPLSLTEEPRLLKAPEAPGAKGGSGDNGERGVKGYVILGFRVPTTSGGEGYVILGFRVPTTSVGARGVKGMLH